jgi:hypothetical protein
MGQGKSLKRINESCNHLYCSLGANCNGPRANLEIISDDKNERTEFHEYDLNLGSEDSATTPDSKIGICCHVLINTTEEMC